MRAVVVGSSLPGLAAALRLAKVGHDVTLVEQESTLGGRWRDPALWPPALLLPAAWRDLLRKSGRTLEAELGRRGLALAPAPAPQHILPDGRRVPLPAERRSQTAVLDRVLGAGAGGRWTSVVDGFDTDWQRLRRHGLEADDPVDRRAFKAMQPRRTLAQAAADLGPAGPLLAWLAWPDDPRRVPAWEGARASVEREFGRWRLVDADGLPVAFTSLLELMVGRLDDRRVVIAAGCRAECLSATRVETDAGTLAADAVVDATSPWSGLSPRPRHLRPALSPTVTCHVATDASAPPVVDHTARTLTYPLRTPEGNTRVTWDFSRPVSDPSAGTAWDGSRSWRRRPDLVGADGVIRASAASRGGSELWAQLLTGALAAYAAHEHGGGRSIRPVDDPRKRRAREATHHVE